VETIKAERVERTEPATVPDALTDALTDDQLAIQRAGLSHEDAVRICTNAVITVLRNQLAAAQAAQAKAAGLAP
jgi:hypothetical protein